MKKIKLTAKEKIERAQALAERLDGQHKAMNLTRRAKTRTQYRIS